MNKNLLVWRLLLGKKLQHGIVICIMALGVALATTVLLLAEGMHGSMVQASKPFPLLMGAKGSPNQLVLNSVFLKDQPVGNFAYDEVESLRRSKAVEQAIPLAFGDNYKGLPLVGTEKELFGMKPLGQQEPWLKLAQGRAFSGEQEAVLGAEAARLSGLRLGDSFASVHGMVNHANGKAHSIRYKVVGILQPLHGPYDKAVFVPLTSVWQQHRHGAEQEREVTAALIRPTGYAAAMQLAGSYSKHTSVQVVFPAKIMIQLFTIMGNVGKLLQALNLAVVALALLIIAGSLYWYALCSGHQRAIMQAVGASVGQVIDVYFRVGMSLVTVGLGLGVALGHLLYYALGSALQSSAGLYLAQRLLMEEGLLVAAVLLLGACCSWLPAYWTAAHSDIAEQL